MIREQMIYAFGCSWSSVFAGALTSLALFVILAVIGMALGFKVIEPKSDEPAHGLGKTLSVWGVVTVIVAMLGGGFMAGIFAGQRGWEHGFLVWALVALVTACFSTHALGSAARTVGSAVRGFGSGAAGLASGVSKGALHTASGAISDLKDNINLHFDSDKLNEQVSSVLRDTEIETLQPDYLRQQMREARGDIRKLLHSLSLEPSNYEKLITDFLNQEKSRLEALTKDINKDDAIDALAKTRDIPRDEAETLVNNALETYHQVVGTAKEKLSNANEQLEDAKEQLKEMADHARDRADKMSNSAAKGATAAAAALVLAAAIAMGGGCLGVKAANDWPVMPSSYIISR